MSVITKRKILKYISSALKLILKLESMDDTNIIYVVPIKQFFDKVNEQHKVSHRFEKQPVMVEGIKHKMIHKTCLQYPLNIRMFSRNPGALCFFKMPVLQSMFSGKGMSKCQC